jgi:hypothetical protein
VLKTNGKIENEARQAVDALRSTVLPKHLCHGKATVLCTYRCAIYVAANIVKSTWVFIYIVRYFCAVLTKFGLSRQIFV